MGKSSLMLPLKQTNKLQQTDILPNACAQEALQTPALAKVWSKQPEIAWEAIFFNFADTND